MCSALMRADAGVAAWRPLLAVMGRGRGGPTGAERLRPKQAAEWGAQTALSLSVLSEREGEGCPRCPSVRGQTEPQRHVPAQPSICQPWVLRGHHVHRGREERENRSLGKSSL